MTLEAGNGALSPRARAATALRRLGHALVGGEVGDDQLVALAETAEGWLSKLQEGAVRRRPADGLVTDVLGRATPGEGDAVEHFDDCPVSGPANPFSLPFTARRVGDGVVGQVTLGSAHEGAPGRSHGGVVAALFDDAFGFLTMTGRLTTYAGTLTVRYLGPTPLNQPLEVTCAFGKREGRRQHATAELRHRGVRVAEASVILVIMPPAEMTRATYDY